MQDGDYGYNSWWLDWTQLKTSDYSCKEGQARQISGDYCHQTLNQGRVLQGNSHIRATVMPWHPAARHISRQTIVKWKRVSWAPIQKLTFQPWINKIIFQGKHTGRVPVIRHVLAHFLKIMNSSYYLLLCKSQVSMYFHTSWNQD